MRTHRTLLTLSSLLLAALAVAPAAQAAEPAGITPSDSGWVVVRKPTAAVSYVPALGDRGNLFDRTVTVARDGVGSYTVVWSSLVDATDGGVQVTAMGSTQRWCLAFDWGTWDVGSAYVQVRCYQRANDPGNQNAALVDSRFAVVLTHQDGPVTSSRKLAYVYGDIAAGDGTPFEARNYTNAGPSVTQEHLAPGSLRFTLPGVAKADGALLLTGYIGAPRSCQARSLAADGADVVATVDCVDLTGAHIDANLDLMYLRRLTPEGYGGKPGAYVFADRPTTASYHPTSHSWSTSGKAATIKRAKKGVYTVTLPGMPAGGAAIVTPWGPRNAPRSCQLGAIRTTGTPQRITVRCFAMDGTPRDSAFSLAYTK